VVFQSFIFGQILAKFGKFWQFWADFPAFTVDESMPELGLKSSKSHNFLTMSPNVTWNSSLESYHHIYSLKKFQKIQKFISFIVAYPRMKNPISVNNVL
jgi:hypothetical protein